MITVPTENQDPSTVRRMFAIALAVEATPRAGASVYTETPDRIILARADLYLHYIESRGKKE